MPSWVVRGFLVAAPAVTYTVLKANVDVLAHRMKNKRQTPAKRER